MREVDAGTRRASIVETWTTRRTPSRVIISTDGGHQRRAEILAELRTGRLKIRDVETINAIDATLGDTTNARAPFVFLHVSGCAHLHEVETRATLSVRD